jgi:hypothetical protein
MFLYHCNGSNVEGRWVMRVATITAYNDAYIEDDAELNKRQLFSVKKFEGEIVVPYQIIDMEKLMIEDTGT